MRKLIGWSTFVLLLCASVAFSADLVNPFVNGAELKNAQLAVDEINKEGVALNTEGKALTQKSNDLKWSAKELEKLTTRWKTERDSLNIEVPRLVQRLQSMESTIQNYNSRCERTFTYPANQGPPPEYYACVNEKAQLAPIADRLRSEQSSMESRIQSSNTMQKTLQEGWKVNEEETLKWAARQKEYNYKSNDWSARKTAVEARLAAIKAKSDACDTAIRTNNIEDMKAICGIQFDGNKTKPTKRLKPQKGGLTVTPNK